MIGGGDLGDAEAGGGAEGVKVGGTFDRGPADGKGAEAVTGDGTIADLELEQVGLADEPHFGGGCGLGVGGGEEGGDGSHAEAGAEAEVAEELTAWLREGGPMGVFCHDQAITAGAWRSQR
jgi:hypothetical protein